MTAGVTPIGRGGFQSRVYQRKLFISARALCQLLDGLVAIIRLKELVKRVCWADDSVFEPEALPVIAKGGSIVSLKHVWSRLP